MNKETRWEPLLKDGVKGEVFVMNLSQNDTYTFGRIKMMPHSSIPLHPHKFDCEWYLDEETGETYFCPKGESHDFVNDSNKIKYLLSVKKAM
ncbi:MAG: cupin domain-containing protein [Clostridia bacterium]|nr:cupin domain-containing protein [Clostridia bacterium]